MQAQSQQHAGSAAELSDQELAEAVANSLGPAGIVPVEHGFNASLISSSQHDSIAGWSNVLTPTVAYRFNRYVSADVSTPVLLYLRTEEVSAPAPPGSPPTPPSTTVAVQHGIFADTFLAGHVSPRSFRAGRSIFYDTVTAQLIAPTGSVSDGVGAGKMTWNVTNHLESGTRFAPFVDIGIGTSSRVQNLRLQQNQTSRGELANFAAGVRLDLPRRLELGLEAFEQLPFGSAVVSQTAARPGGPPETQPTQVTSGLAENNGFNTALDIPLQTHTVLSGFYSRSLRQHEDIAGFSFTFLLHAAHR